MATESTTDQPTSPPLRIGVALFPGFQALDVFGPLDCLNILSWTHTNMSMSILAATLDPVSTQIPESPHTIGQHVVPTHTFSSPPPLDVLLVPGGLGTRGSPPELLQVIDFIRTVYPSLKYLITVCTGSGVAARAGVLDGRRATTNKLAWKEITALGPNVSWVPRARWVVDGNVWTASGVTAGIDATIAWIEEVFGAEMALEIANGMEHTRHTDPEVDPFADLYGLA
ncbi:class I glutamine amidotransferase-like protein [Aspergillus heteromorphus CBS 117.55]|uniref:Class I glutamine amidotransferase-like protein n=1 Tax=Aspergillus heteromorphus CBS 117.55 TaxID=1448321 RepID=A0A317X0X5_9EURO|nr:class I glutamine amidotransferase-like protein [Aspergillus heteromorphus CBS 117.55]PWY92203.1 class I glutamine amidotransferase-like protein [Aspergillus heteromorphus CBS 117.55]